jgi:hypothetical protein
MQNKKQKIISVIIGATGTISESYRKYLSNIPGKDEIKYLQKKQSYWVWDTYLYFGKC